MSEQENKIKYRKYLDDVKDMIKKYRMEYAINRTFLYPENHLKIFKIMCIQYLSGIIDYLFCVYMLEKYKINELLGCIDSLKDLEIISSNERDDYMHIVLISKCINENKSIDWM